MSQMTSLLRDRTRSSIIEAKITLADEERKYIEHHSGQMLTELAWNTVVPNPQSWSRSSNALATELRAYEPHVKEMVQTLYPKIVDQLNHREISGKIEIHLDGHVTVWESVMLELIFSSFHPTHIGVIDYHGPHRNYAREALGGINLNLEQEEEKLRTTSLYNAANKYSNIKSEMAAEYVKQYLRERVSTSEHNRGGDSKLLTHTLQELFKTFFPNKTFDGPVPTYDGNLEFPVQVGDGSAHDINDLSSGEKEILFGYLRLTSSAPKYSVILLDEPELHLNPALVRGLPQFYYKHVGKALENQIWLVTHSDAFLREAIGHDDLQVFHMQYAQSKACTTSQMHELQPGEEIQSIILELVGNLATYSPNEKVVFFEGEDSEFDLHMVSRLFPTVENDLNPVSGGNKFRVEMLHKTLERSAQASNIPVRIYSVVDSDTGRDGDSTIDNRRHFAWDVYHIENYLLEPKYIDSALGSLGIAHGDLSSLGKIDLSLKSIAESQIGKLASHEIRVVMNSMLINELNLNTNPTSEDIGGDLHRAANTSVLRISDQLATNLEVDRIRDKVDAVRCALREALKTDEWKKRFRGRDILKIFAGKYVKGMQYRYFRNLIITQMVNSGYQPAGMKTILDKIIND